MSRAVDCRGRGALCSARLWPLWLAAAALAGCAKPGPPGGGPVDSTPPEIEAAVPPGGAVLVDPLAPIELRFSEEMNRESVERALAITPAVTVRSFRWRGTSLLVEPAAALADSTTFVVRLAQTARDYHDVALRGPYASAFSTGAALDRGVIAGAVSAGPGQDARATVWACPPPAPADSARILRPCGYETIAGSDGGFRVQHVKAIANPYTIIAFIDADGDGRFSRRTEVGAVIGGAAHISAPADSAVGIVIPLPATPTSQAPAGLNEGRETE